MTSTVVELLRNATAHAKDLWEFEDRRRPLDDAGYAQADRLASTLPAAGEPLAAIASSPAARCMQTVGPLGASLGLTVAGEPGLQDVFEVPTSDDGDRWLDAAWKGGRALAVVDRLVTAHRGSRVVVCSHGDVIPSLVALLVGRDALSLPDVRCPPAGRFTLTFTDGRCTGVVPVAPPPRPRSSLRQEPR